MPGHAASCSTSRRRTSCSPILCMAILWLGYMAWQWQHLQKRGLSGSERLSAGQTQGLVRGRWHMGTPSPDTVQSS